MKIYELTIGGLSIPQVDAPHCNPVWVYKAISNWEAINMAARLSQAISVNHTVTIKLYDPRKGVEGKLIHRTECEPNSYWGVC